MINAQGTTYTPAKPKPGQVYWKLISAEGPDEWGGRHSVFVDVVDEQGRRLIGVPVTFYWNGNDVQKLTEPKAGEPWAVDFPMYAAGSAYGVRVGDDIARSDQLFGMGLIANEPHVVYKLTFQRTVATGTDTGTGPTVPQGKDKIQVVVNGVVVWEN